MNLTPSRWRSLSGPAKYRVYTRLSMQGLPLYLGVLYLLPARGHAVPTAVIVASTVAAVLACQARPELTGRTGRHDRAFTAVAAVLFAAAWLVGGVATDLGNESPFNLGVVAFSLASMTLFAFYRHRWNIMLVAAAATLALYGWPLGLAVQAVLLVAVGAVFMSIARFSLWALRLVDDLDRARETQARLHVAEERLRFARDLHDVVGRGFSTIAVKSELASRLARSDADGATARAATEMDEVKSLAVASMEEMRSLVRGYRGIDLAGEVAGARSLLSAAGCRLDVDGAPDDVPERFHEAAAWVVREGTTNIVRHSAADVARLSLRTDGLRLRNDGAPDRAGNGSGLRGLAERLEPLGATLTADLTDGVFTLDICWEAA